MKKTISYYTSLALTVFLFGFARSLAASSPVTIYNNSSNDLFTTFSPGTLEVGDEISFGSPERYLQVFSFEYWGTNTGGGAFAGNVTAEIKFYANDGPMFNGYATPGTPLFSSAPFSLSTTPRSTVIYSSGSDWASGGLYLGPITNMTWSVKFSGMLPGDSVGVDIYDPPVVGGNFADYWENNGGWSLRTNSLAPMNFASTMTATPEPSVVALAITGGLGLLAARRWLPRKRR